MFIKEILFDTLSLITILNPIAATAIMLSLVKLKFRKFLKKQL